MKRESETRRYLWFGGQRRTDSPLTSISGGVVSSTLTVTVSEAVPSTPSSTVSVISCTPSGSTTLGVAPVASAARLGLLQV
jgi:hypothetical protein